MKEVVLMNTKKLISWSLGKVFHSNYILSTRPRIISWYF